MSVRAGYGAGLLLAGMLALAGCGRSSSDLQMTRAVPDAVLDTVPTVVADAGPETGVETPADAGARVAPRTRASTVGVMPPDILTPASRLSLPFVAVRPRSEPPYSNDQVLRNFLSIALRAEAADDVGPDGGIAISKWRDPIRYRLVGARTRDRVQIAALSDHLAALTGLDIREAGEVERYNMDIRFIPPEGRAAEMRELLATQWLGPRVARLAEGWRDYEIDRCFALTTRDPTTGVTGTAHVFIKDELPLVWRETCIIEEMAQSLGLLNDDPRANPSIFNDDGAYQALTTHDELLLRILYDPRIRSGMHRDSVQPLAERIVAELRPAGVSR